MSLKTMLDSYSNGTFLKGSDVPDGVQFVFIKAAGVRKPPAPIKAACIIDFATPVYGKTGWTVNTTNMRVLIKLFGEDEEELVGKTIKLEVISAFNPQIGEIVRSLAVSLTQ